MNKSNSTLHNSDMFRSIGIEAARLARNAVAMEDGADETLFNERERHKDFIRFEQSTLLTMMAVRLLERREK